jgi:hypothetical protein
MRSSLVLQTTFLLTSGLPALAVFPLVVDDADTVAARHLQLNAGCQFSDFTRASHHTLAVNPVLGLTPRGEFGAIFGGQWLAEKGDDGATTHASGLTDLNLATKWRVWQTTSERFRVATRLDLKLPTASEADGLGTGHADLGGVVIATGTWGRTGLDWNFGYTANALAKGRAADDFWFAGQSVRHELSQRWTLLGEVYAFVPSAGGDTETHVFFNGGAQFVVRENLLISALLGSAAGCESPNLTSFLGFTWEF